MTEKTLVEPEVWVEFARQEIRELGLGQYVYNVEESPLNFSLGQNNIRNRIDKNAMILIWEYLM